MTRAGDARIPRASIRDRPTTAIMNASSVPMPSPFAYRASTSGSTPAAFEYRGMPISTAKGTASGLPGPA